MQNGDYIEVLESPNSPNLKFVSDETSPREQAVEKVDT
ncbi:hypothetical protein AM1_1218 [Acaryochloris marina MBIC11017]|uniref:Uncharacterized protein n=1 Tax=Acaryochloris marina (strain MBIC 11017) TaxID=329726 RepID=B0C3Z5_ACAM1|nr:hypothetical protein AM1_1218 [Acaryochloris marina MBIC11017]